MNGEQNPMLRGDDDHDKAFEGGALQLEQSPLDQSLARP
jgi:hypothetical protein